MLVVEGSIYYLCKLWLDVIPALKWALDQASQALFCKTPFQGLVILAVYTPLSMQIISWQLQQTKFNPCVILVFSG